MTGKEKCILLRHIRQEIADMNHIFYQPSPCTYEGDDCRGTCPKCDLEAQYLETMLNRKAAAGERIMLSGLSMDEFGSGFSLIPESVHRDDDFPLMGLICPPEDIEDIVVSMPDMDIW